MPIAAVAFNTLRDKSGRVVQNALTSVERCWHYGYTVVVECDGVSVDEAKAFCREHLIPVHRFSPLRGMSDPSPDVIFDGRCPTWGGWRVSMVTIDEAHRKQFFDYRKQLKQPVKACLIEAPAEDDECLS